MQFFYFFGIYYYYRVSIKKSNTILNKIVLFLVVVQSLNLSIIMSKVVHCAADEWYLIFVNRSDHFEPMV